MPRATPAPQPAPVPSLPPLSRTFLTVRQFAELMPGLSHGSIRWDIFNEERNGLARSGAIIRRGRRILIDPERYMNWMESREGAQ